MKNEVEEEITETAETIATQQKNGTPKKKISKTAMWAREHKGFIQVNNGKQQKMSYRRCLTI